MKIRNATPPDISAIQDMDKMATEEEIFRQNIRRWMTEGNAVVATIDDVIVGYSVLEYTFFGQGFISMLMVERGSRRRGVATTLVSHLEERCETEKIFTSTNESNKPMQELLKCMSYVPSGIVYNLDDGDPELFYFKRLRKQTLA